MDIKKLVKRNVRSLRAYEAEEIPCKVKLDANESPYGLKILKTVKTNRYPDPEAKNLRRLAAREFGVQTENILHGNGSDELIYYLITTFGGPVLYPVPTFSMYGIIAQALGEKRIGIALDKNFDIDSEKMKKAIAKVKPKLIFLSSPNNPTGNCFSEKKIIKIIEMAKGLVVVDEAYHAFSEKKGFLPLLKRHRNLIVLKTLSKIGFASLRVGFMVSHQDIVLEVNKTRLPFNLNALSQRLAEDAFRDRATTRTHVRSIVSERKRLLREMKKMDGLTSYPSDANFILFRLSNAEGIYKGLLKKGVLVRNLKGIINGCLRVTIGTPRENTIFLTSLKQLI
ncbi:histidinol-phosphate transaminase [bacterium]|nr:MAG: histidinol-phosphate transaminase [bacterium]